MDFTKQKSSKNFIDYTTNPVRDILSMFLDRWSPETQNYINSGIKGDPNVVYKWSPEEEKRLMSGEDVLNILRERMKNEFMYNFLNRKSPSNNFDFHKEDFDTHSNLRGKNKGSYGNY